MIPAGTIFKVNGFIQKITILIFFIIAEWVESRLKVSSYRTHELLKVYFGKFGLQSVKTAIGGFIVPIPTIRGLSQGYDASANIGIGCDAYHAYRIFGWKPKSKRKRVRRGKWIALVRRGGCPFSQKIRLATRLGAAAVVIIDNHDTHEPIAMNTLGTRLKFSIYFITSHSRHLYSLDNHHQGRWRRAGQYDQAIQLSVDHAQASWSNQAARLTTTGRD